jgi:hypothetical protein
MDIAQSASTNYGYWPVMPKIRGRIEKTEIWELGLPPAATGAFDDLQYISYIVYCMIVPLRTAITCRIGGSE